MTVKLMRPTMTAYDTIEIVCGRKISQFNLCLQSSINIGYVKLKRFYIECWIALRRMMDDGGEKKKQTHTFVARSVTMHNATMAATTYRFIIVNSILIRFLCAASQYASPFQLIDKNLLNFPMADILFICMQLLSDSISDGIGMTVIFKAINEKQNRSKKHTECRIRKKFQLQVFPLNERWEKNWIRFLFVHKRRLCVRGTIVYTQSVDAFHVRPCDGGNDECCALH